MKNKQNKVKHQRSDAAKRSVGRKTHREVAATVAALAEPLCAEAGVELVATEYHRESGGRILRVTIDKQGGVSLDDCAVVSRQLSDLLDVYLEQKAAYSLEVSSPGPNRPLVKNEDFIRFEGSKAKISTLQPLEGRKNFTGILRGLNGDRVRLQVDGANTVEIPVEQVKQARLVNYHGEN